MAMHPNQTSVKLVTNLGALLRQAAEPHVEERGKGAVASFSATALVIRLTLEQRGVKPHSAARYRLV